MSSNTALAVVNQGGAQLAYGDMLRPRSIGEAMELAKMLAASDMVPKDYKGKAGNIIAAVQMGAELGLAPMQSLQNIAVINGRPSVWGDALLALCQAHPDFEWIQESVEGDGDGKTAVCKIKRRGNQKPTVGEFSVAQAKKANLWGKQGPWSQYPDRMLQMRARGFACRDAFADALRGLHSAEEVRDIPDERAVVVTQQPEQSPKAALPAPTLASVMAGIASAASRDDLMHVAEAAKRLPPTDKVKAQMAWKKRNAELVELPQDERAVEPPHNQDTGEVRSADDMPAWDEREGQQAEQ